MPGKFYGPADEQVYRLSLDICDDECGSVEYGAGWAGLVILGNDDAAEVEAIAGLSFRPYAAIVVEDSQGFVSVEYLADEAAMDESWSLVLAADAALQDEEG